MTPSRKAGPLEVTLRRIVAADGSEAVRETVPCPRRPDPLPVEKCIACEEFEGTVVAPSGTTYALGCSAEVGPAPRCALRVEVGSLMRGVTCVRDDVPIGHLVKLFLEDRAGAIPVVDERARVVGIVTATDFMRRWAAQEAAPDEWLPAVCARDVMSPDVFTVRPRTPLGEAATLAFVKRMRRLPVVSETGEVLGMVDALDLLERVVPWKAQLDGTRGL